MPERKLPVLAHPPTDASPPGIAGTHRRKLYLLLVGVALGWLLYIPMWQGWARYFTLSVTPFGVALALSPILTIPSGLRLSSLIDIHATPVLDAWLAHRSIAGDLRRAFLVALLFLPLTLVGAALLASAFATLLHLHPTGPDTAPLLAGGSLLRRLALASVGAALAEETEFRLGVLTLIAWLISRLPAIGQSRWMRLIGGNLVSAAMFGLVHQVIQFNGWHGFSPLAALVSGQSMAGFVFGVVYWNFGVETAALLHLLTDLSMVGMVAYAAGH